MTKKNIKEIVRKCMEERLLCRACFKYHTSYWYLFPLAMNETLFLSAGENDFIIDGYQIRRFRDIKKAETKNDFLHKIFLAEHVIDSITVPEVDICDWESVFRSLHIRNKNVIIETESLIDSECEFTIGRIEKVFRRFAYVRHFDADGNWQDTPYKIPYNEITSLTFNSRYVDFYSKYVDGAYPKA